MIQTKLYSGFPGVGKTNLFNNTSLKILDSDSSTFDKEFFPQNYIEHIKNNIGKVDIILISSHQEVRDALVNNGISFNLVYPSVFLKNEYIERYVSRGSNHNFINFISKNWFKFMDQLTTQENCKHIVLKSNQYLSDII